MGLGIGTIAAIISATSAVVSLAMTLTMRPDNQDIKDSGTSIDRKGQNNPKVVPFGRCMVPSVRVWSNVNNSNTRWLAQAHSFGVGPILKFEQVFIDGVRYFNNQPSIGTWYTGNSSSCTKEFPNLDMGLRLGANKETAYSQLFGHSDGEWDASCRGDRTASASLLVERFLNKEDDNDIRIMSDRFKVEALVHGVAVIDPRFSLENRTWVNTGKNSYRNPACVLYTYLVDTYYGMGVPADAIHTQSFIELANYCDQAGLTFDGYIDQGSDYGQILIDMCTAFDGVAYVEDGQIKVKADKSSPAVAHITMDDMVGSFRLSNANDSSYYNIVNLEFINADTNFTVDKYVLPRDVANNAIIRNDGFEKAKDIKFTYTTDFGSLEKVKLIANKHLKKAKYQQSIEFEIDNTKKDVHLYDVIEVTQEDYGLKRKKYRINKIETSLDEKTTVSKISATEYNESVYDESNYDDGIGSPPVKPPTVKVPSPVGLSFEQTGFTTSGRGILSWTTRYNREHRTVVEYKLSSATSWKRVSDVLDEDYEFSNLAPDNYDFRVMTKTFMGSTSPWVSIVNQKVEGGITLPTPTNGSAVFTTGDCVISWDNMKTKPLNVPNTESFDGIKTVADVFSHYEVIVYKGASNTYKETLSSSSHTFTYSHSMNAKSGVNRDLRFEIKIVAKDGSTSRGLIIDALNTQMAQPSGVKVNGELTALTINFDMPTDKDYQASDIHIATTNNFTPSASTLAHTSTGNIVVLSKKYEGVHYLRVGHYDMFGKDGMSYSAAIAFTMKDIDDLLDDSANWGNINDNFDGLVQDVEDAKQDIIDNATDIREANTTIGQQGALINQNKTAIQGVAGNLAEFEETVEADFNGVNALINTNKTAIANANKAIASLDTELTGLCCRNR
ncbi:phage tail protein, partial [Vibrio sp. ER1A]|uniref:phage tail protein n=1 Tax=Vibrio sp. ER1A TaxID=1517681 RepID=UPI0004DD029C